MAVASSLLKAFGPHWAQRDPDYFLSDLHAAARACAWRLGKFEAGTGFRSYVWQSATFRDESISILIASTGCAAGFTAEYPPVRRPPHGDYRFVDRAEFTRALADIASVAPFISAAELNADLTAEDRDFLERISGGMASDMKYWEPQTVGAAIFNEWD